jgi:hypothetical protein
VIGGDAIVDSDDDKPRDTLLDLVTAKVARDIGLNPSLTADDEDVRLDCPGVGRGAIECKRPRRPDTLRKNLIRIGNQLRERAKAGSTFGMATIGADRLLGLADGRVLRGRDRQEVERITNAASLRVLNDVQATARDPASRLVPAASAALVVVAGAVQLSNRQGIYLFGHVGQFPLLELSQMPPELERLLMQPQHEGASRFSI